MSMIMKGRKALAMLGGILALLTLSLMSEAPPAHAAEGGADYYLPGIYGNMGLASLPGPGFYYVNYTVYQNGDLDKAVRFGREQVDLEIDIVANAFVPIYIFDYELFGAHPLVGAAMVYMGISEDIGVDGSRGTDVTNSKFDFGDATIVPFGLSWVNEGWSVLFYESINVPIGQYDVNDPVSMGYNYWAFDTNLGASYDLLWGFKANGNLGHLWNTKNTDTNYKTGMSLHLDYTLEYDISPRWQVGFSGYYYRQVEGDSGSGATLGSFKGRAGGIGPSVQYIPSHDPVSAINFEWLHDYHATNRLKNDTFILMLAFGIGK
jgi:hypothetical protein